MSLELQPITVRAACDRVRILHRHLPRVVGGLFASTLWAGGELVAVGIASLPKAAASRDGFTVEISRLATDGARNACSRLYGALCRAAAAVGYRRALTFTRLDEPGTSLRAAGFRSDAGPYVCPGCHAVGGERCAPGCIDAELEAEHREAIESGNYECFDEDDLNDSNDWEWVPQ